MFGLNTYCGIIGGPLQKMQYQLTSFQIKEEIINEEKEKEALK